MSVLWLTAWSITSSMFSGVCSSRPMMLEPSTRIPCDCSSRISAPGVRAGELGVLRVLPLHAEPHPVDAQADQLFHAVSPQDVGGAEDFQVPRLAVLLHEVEQLQRPLPVQAGSSRP